MRFIKALVIAAAVTLTGTGLAALPRAGTATAHPATEHAGFSLHECAEICAAGNSGTTAQLPPAVVGQDEERQDDEAEPVPKPDAQYYAHFTRLAEPQGLSPDSRHGPHAARPPDIFKLNMNYRD